MTERRHIEMGLDLEIVEGERDMDMSELYAILDAIREKFDWRLDGGDRHHTYNVKSSLVRTLTKNAVLEKYRGIDFSTRPSEERDMKFLEGIPEFRFNKMVLTIADSIGDFDERNTSLEFDYDRLPQKDVVWTTSWDFRTIILRCQADWHKFHSEYVIELDGKMVKVLAKKWKRMGWRLALTKWTRYFSPDAAERMLDDIIKELDVSDPYTTLDELVYYRNLFLEVLKKHDFKKRIWLMSSY